MVNSKKLFLIDDISENMIADLDYREAAVWLRSLPNDPATQENLPAFFGLPWRMVFSEVSDFDLIKSLEEGADASDPMTLKRGFIQIIDDDPSRIELPPRCLPVYLLNGRQGSASNDFRSRFRRMAMLEELRRSGVRQLFIISGDEDPVPPDLVDLWSSGFRSYLTFSTDAAKADDILTTWMSEVDGLTTVSLLRPPVVQVVATILQRYATSYPEERVVIRIRNHSGKFRNLDITGLDEPEHPLLSQYALIEERHLAMLTPEQLSEEDFVAFFQNPESSWRPYAAGLPWERDGQFKQQFDNVFKKIDIVGPEENCVAYVLSEPGAGGTTFARMLAFEYAREGYPVLVAKHLPFVPDALSVVNFLNRIRLENAAADDLEYAKEITQEEYPDRSAKTRRYEAPWIIVFDISHWEYRDSELRQFYNEIQKSGRPVCVVVVSGPIRELEYFNTSIFRQVGELDHSLDKEQAQQLGRHLNQFLRVYGKSRDEHQWDRFFQQHTVRYVEGLSAFWVTLSFWIQGQYDLSESIQEWMYRSFKEHTEEGIMQAAILEIAALSSERLPMPEGLLPESNSEWPISHLLDDRRANLGALGLIRISVEGERYWALVHDILGRFLINAVFYDFSMREKLGFSEANDPEHLRFLLLKKVSEKRELGERDHKELGEGFATSIFKIDPDHGHAIFAIYWREVLEALNNMPRPLRDTSRAFRHHTAISRRRIAKLNEAMFGVTINDQATLLIQGIEDIKYALSAIDYKKGSESDTNLFNSLALAYLDLAQVETEKGSDAEKIANLLRLANDATRHAYEESPTNSYVIETYVTNLLASIQSSPESAISNCIEALGILFSAMSSDEDSYRRPQRSKLADRAIDILFKQAPENLETFEPDGPIDVLTKAWVVLSEGVDFSTDFAFLDLPKDNRIRAIDVLAHPAGLGNMQVIRLSYELICITYPREFKRQLEYLEQLQSSEYHSSPQLRLEYGILLYQNGRPMEGNKVFLDLRKLWRESEYFVHVPDRLRWLRDSDSDTAKTVQAVVASDRDLRPMARVNEFQNNIVPFRPEEFDLREVRPGIRFGCFVSFGHNGPFLRPVTARTS